MNRLKLEHIAPYLPYGLKCYIKERKDENNNPIISVISGATHDYIIIDGEHEDEYINYSDCMPLLYKVKDFDKMDNEFDLSTDFETCYITNRDEIAFVNTSDKTYLSDISTVINFIYKMNIDIYGLIENDLAIDINTIK